jgi:hypothetical protein
LLLESAFAEDFLLALVLCLLDSLLELSQFAVEVASLSAILIPVARLENHDLMFEIGNLQLILLDLLLVL